MEPSAGLDVPIVERRFTTPGVDPFDEVEWEIRDAWPTVEKYRNANIEVPKSWSQNALDITSKLYLAKGSRPEKSIKDLIMRVAEKIRFEGLKHGYFGKWTAADANAVDFSQVFSTEVGQQTWDTSLVFRDELKYILLHQMGAFNSPVWFNVGRTDRPQQVSACFILSVDDNTESIMETARREAFIFKGGSGSGFDVSRLRGSQEPLSTGGTASGPVSFMRLWDAGAGTFKSGGTTRRAAKLVKCDINHPDIRDFITCKAREEQHLRILAAGGLHIGLDEAGERNVAEVTSFQNANNSVGVTDDFMKLAIHPSFAPLKNDWALIARKTGEQMGEDNASELLALIAESAWDCACPGMQFMDTMNAWHTTPMINGEPSPIRSSNPCGEYLSNDDTSCNLASLNVLKFLWFNDSVIGFDVEGYQHTVDIFATAMDILVEFADFPDNIIAHNTRAMRQLGLGYSNMGAAIMAQGLPYDSDDARDFAASVTALSTGRTYRRSAQLARELGAFTHYAENEQAMSAVIDKHTGHLPIDVEQDEIWSAAARDWHSAAIMGRAHGFRNAQASVLAPAGSISYLMDCDTTGIEPAFELVSYKELAGGGSMTLINSSVKRAAESLGGYSEGNLKQLAEGDISCISPEDLPTFHTANQISAEGHIKMLAAVQPFVSGGISKTINLPESAAVADVKAAYVLAWQLGVKDLAIYRNNSKARQVLSSAPKEKSNVDVALEVGERIRSGSMLDLSNGASIEFVEGAVHQAGGPHKPKIHAGEVELLEGETKVVFSTGESVDVTCVSSTGEPVRRRMPRTRRSITHKIHVRAAAGTEHEGYVHAGMYEDGSLGEFFIDGFGKSGSFTLNALGSWATDFSICIQYGVPVELLIRKHAFVADETGGLVVPTPGDTLVLRECKSVIDYIARWLASEFCDTDFCEEMGVMTQGVKDRKAAALDKPFETYTTPEVADRILESLDPISNGHASSVSDAASQPCGQCGGTMYLKGGCFQCRCGHNTGCG